jgi:hypothetical protein
MTVMTVPELRDHDQTKTKLGFEIRIVIPLGQQHG